MAPCRSCQRVIPCPCHLENPYADPAWREKIADVLRDWETAGYIGPAWSVEHDTGDGCFRIAYTLFNTWGDHPRRYNLNENDFCERMIALADMFPDEAGEAAVALAEEVREEAP